jgi:hypothetical protein
MSCKFPVHVRSTLLTRWRNCLELLGISAGQLGQDRGRLFWISVFSLKNRELTPENSSRPTAPSASASLYQSQ